MYAILQHGGRQHRVGPGDRLVLDRLDAEVGAVVALEPVLFVSDGAEGTAGSTDTEGARVAATVVAHRRGPKLRVFKYKPKKRYRRTIGHRSDLTELRVESLVARGASLPKAGASAPKASSPAAKKPKAARPDTTQATEGAGDGA